MDTAHHRRREDLPPRGHTRHLQAVVYVGPGLLEVERPEVVARGDALVQLAQLRAGQHRRQLRLADQDNLQQLLAVGFQVGQQPDLLQYVVVQVLGLIDQQYRLAPQYMVHQQEMVQLVGQRLEGEVVAVVVDDQLVADRGEQFHRVQRRIEDDGDVGIVGQLLQQAAVDGGLARAHFTGQENESAARTHAVEQMRQGIPVARAHKQIARIDRYGKRRFPEPEILVIHVAAACRQCAET